MSKKSKQSEKHKIMLSEHFSYDEMVRSQTALRLKISNRPSYSYSINLLLLCCDLLEPIRKRFASPVIVTSGYRSERLNRAVGGALNSRHLFGRAADITASDFKTLCTVVDDMCKAGEISPSELIFHDTYIHIAL